MGAEPLTALDLADTVITVADPPIDLIADPAQARVWWRLQAGRLPAGPPPDADATRRLRAAIRDVLDGHLERRAAHPTSIDDLNAASAAAPVSLRLNVTGGRARVDPRWHTEHGGNPALAAIARETIEFLADPGRLALLRRCSNPSCSMVFLAHNKRRIWCTANGCGNRARVARHYERAHPTETTARTD